MGFLKTPVSTYLWFFYSITGVDIISNLITVSKIGIWKLVFVTFLVVFPLNNATTYVTSCLFNYNFSNMFTIDGNFFYFITYSILGSAFRNAKYSDSFKERLIYYLAPTFILISLSTIYLTSYSSVYYGKQINYFYY